MKKIMFNDEYGLTDAVLKGRKTMTRRVCKEFRTLRIIIANEVESVGVYSDENLVEFVMKDGSVKVSVPSYKVGEVVAVAQSYKDLKLSYIPHIDEPDFKTCTKHAPLWGNPRGMQGWNNKMFVRPDLMPHQIQITNIKVERLQDISDEDCMCEGVVWDYNDYPIMRRKVYLINDYESFLSPCLAFAALVNRICGKSTWEINPYVFAYTFELIK